MVLDLQKSARHMLTCTSAEEGWAEGTRPELGTVLYLKLLACCDLEETWII